MSDISVTTQQSVIAVTQTSGITVTTPTGQTIDVNVPNSSVDVTNTTDDITILTSGQLYINSSGVITSVNGNTGPIVVLTTTNIAEGTNLYYTTARANTDFDTRLATKTTTNLAEGTNLYFTDARVESHVFSEITIDNRSYLNTAILTTSTTGADQVVDTFSAATYRTVKYLVSISSGTEYQAVEVLVVHNGTTAQQTVYADITTGVNLATFTVDIAGGSVRLLTTPVNAVTVYKVTRTALVV